MREKSVSIVGLIFLVLLVAIAIRSDPAITGFQVLQTPEDYASLLKMAVEQSPAFSQVSMLKMCVLMNDGPTLEVTKTIDGVSVVQSHNEYCRGIATEDIVIKFNSPADFTTLARNPTRTLITQSHTGVSYHILPSRLVQSGGNVICDVEFKAAFCPAVSSLANADQLIDGDMACCLDSITFSQRSRIQRHYAQTGFVDEYGVIASAELISPFSAAGLSPFLVALFVLILAAILALVFVVPRLRHKITQEVIDPKEQELIDYVKNTLSQGYDADGIKTYLLEQGWSPKQVDLAMQKAQDSSNNQVSIPAK